MFLFRLAGHLGKTVAQLERELDSRELTEWVAVHRIDMWPWDRVEGMLAQLAFIVSAALGSQASFDDFLIYQQKPPKPIQSPQQMWTELLKTLER